MVLEGVDLWGGDLRSYPGYDVDDCCRACTSLLGCGAFTFVPWGNICYLKTAGGWESLADEFLMSVVLDSSGGGSLLLLHPSPPPPHPSPSPRPLPPLPSPRPPPRQARPPPPSPAATKRPPPPGVDVPRINDGRCVNGSEPRVVQLLGNARSTYHFYHPEYRVRQACWMCVHGAPGAPRCARCLAPPGFHASASPRPRLPAQLPPFLHPAAPCTAPTGLPGRRGRG